jgi:AraC family transcriptional regulator of adaptative response / DNA-3-methyladenine glycosylase II
VRQFNDVMRAEFGCAPSALRRRPGATDGGAGSLTLRLQHRSPLAVGPLLGWLAARAVPGVEEVTDGRYRRVLGAGVVELEPVADAGHVVLRVRAEDLSGLTALVARCRRLLDLDADPAAVDAALGADETLAPHVARHPGLRVPGAVDGFELAVRAVLGQQVSVAGARTLAGRLAAAYGEPLATRDGSLRVAFPTAEALADADLSGVGLTGARAATLRALAHEVADGRLALDPLCDHAETRQRLLALPGIGPWTAEYVAMRGLGDPDAFPATDLVLRRAVAGAADRAERWRPWRAYAAMHLWNAHAEGALP